jgi:hypothetical protein
MAAGADRTVFAGAECLLLATTTAAVAALAVTDDAVSGPFGKASIGEGLAIAAAPGADRLVLLGAELRFRPRRERTRPWSLIGHDGAGRKNCRQEQDGKTLPLEDCRKKPHGYTSRAHSLEPRDRKGSCAKSKFYSVLCVQDARRCSPVPAQNTPSHPRHSIAKCNPRLQTVACRKQHLRPIGGPCVAGLWPMTGRRAGSIDTVRRNVPIGRPAALSCNLHVSVR